METSINLNRIEAFGCLEPEVGAQLLPLYPEFLSEEEQQQFELHREGCENCQERWKLWQVTGLALRIETILKRAMALLKERRHEEAIREYNRVLALDPNVLTTPKGQEFFRTETWLPLTAARSKEKNLMSYIAPSYAPDVYEFAAAESAALFPVSVEYAEGKVQGQFSTAGNQVFFELLKADQDFKNGVKLLGKISRDSDIRFKIWAITPGKRCRLETVAHLFGSGEFPDIIKALRAFKVFPLLSS